jgi:hypothetical protein
VAKNTLDCGAFVDPTATSDCGSCLILQHKKVKAKSDWKTRGLFRAGWAKLIRKSTTRMIDVSFRFPCISGKALKAHL